MGRVAYRVCPGRWWRWWPGRPAVQGGAARLVMLHLFTLRRPTAAPRGSPGPGWRLLSFDEIGSEWGPGGRRVCAGGGAAGGSVARGQSKCAARRHEPTGRPYGRQSPARPDPPEGRRATQHSAVPGAPPARFEGGGGDGPGAALTSSTHRRRPPRPRHAGVSDVTSAPRRGWLVVTHTGAGHEGLLGGQDGDG